MKSLTVFGLALVLAVGVIPSRPLLAAEVGKAMTDKELKALLDDGEVLTLGGPGFGYKGKLTVKPDGTAAGSATTDDGKAITISGRWTVSKGRFCRTWAELDGGKQVCETWVYKGPNAVEVKNGKKTIGHNQW